MLLSWFKFKGSVHGLLHSKKALKLFGIQVTHIYQRKLSIRFHWSAASLPRQGRAFLSTFVCLFNRKENGCAQRESRALSILQRHLCGRVGGGWALGVRPETPVFTVAFWKVRLYSFFSFEKKKSLWDWESFLFIGSQPWRGLEVLKFLALKFLQV